MTEYYLFSEEEMEKNPELVNYFYKSRNEIQKNFFEMPEKIREIINMKEILAEYVERSFLSPKKDVKKRFVKFDLPPQKR